MATGTITSLRTEKGFGFIKKDNAGGAGDLFFHHSAVEGASFDNLREGQAVSFEEGQDPRDPTRRRATAVRLAGDADGE